VKGQDKPMGQEKATRVSARENNNDGSEQRWLRVRLKRLSDDVPRHARTIDVSGATAAEVLDRHKRASEILEELRTEILHWFRDTWRKFREDEVLRTGALRVLERGLQLAEYLMAEQLATYTEIYRRVHKNETNFQFGQLLIAHRNGDIAGSTHAYFRLRRLLRGIPYQRQCYTNDPQQWQSVINGALGELCAKHASLNVREIFTRMMENGFAYVYKAVGDRVIDEFRRNERRRSEVQSLRASFFETVPQCQPSPERDLQIESLARLVEATSPTLEPKYQAILKIFAQGLRELEWVAEHSQAELNATVVKEIAQVRDVTLQQARADLKHFQEESREEFVRFREELRMLGAERALKVTLREVSSENYAFDQEEMGEIS